MSIHRLLEKLDVESEALKGRVFDILGEVFEETSLQGPADRGHPLRRPARGPRPPAAQRSSRPSTTTTSRRILDRNALAQEIDGARERLFAVKEEMEKAEARRLQPYFVRSFFTKAFEHLGGALRPREAGRCEITHVPALIRERDRQLTGRNRRDRQPVLRSTSGSASRNSPCGSLDRVGAPMASLIHPGHPADAGADRPGAGAASRHAPAGGRPGRSGRHGPHPQGDVHPRSRGQGRARSRPGRLPAYAVRRDRPARQRQRSPAGRRTSIWSPSPRQTCVWWRTCCRRRGSRQNLEQVALALPRPSSCPSTSRRCARAASGTWTRPWRPSTSA